LDPLQRRANVNAESTRKSSVQIRVVIGGKRKSIDRRVTLGTERDEHKTGAQIGTRANLKDSPTTWLEAAPLPPLHDTQHIIDRALDVAPRKRSRPSVTKEPMASHVRHAEPSASREPARIPCDSSQELHVEATGPRLPQSCNVMSASLESGCRGGGILAICPGSASSFVAARQVRTDHWPRATRQEHPYAAPQSACLEPRLKLQDPLARHPRGQPW
jgi:hypothetical protein